ncbi:hypothetical protein Tco_0925400 [Tanacetum coccineum]|uniref:Uncharacterized protein n=1 Tax=Tanacetum coccineum TaxID=301880 RepID=A0ABQ5D9P4_9ASTR
MTNIPCDSNKDDDSKQRVSHEADDDMGYDPSNVAFTEWLGGDDEVELTDEEFSDNEDEVAKVFRIDTNIFDFETPILVKNIKMIGSMNGTRLPWVDENKYEHGVWTEPTPVKHYCKPFNYKTGRSEWPTCNWKNDGYCNEENLPGAYIVGNSLHYQDYEWEKLYIITYHDHDEIKYENETHRQELCEIHKVPVCYIRRFKMIKYSFRHDEEYVAVKEVEYDGLTNTSKDARQAYQEIFRMMDEGWMVTRGTRESNIGEYWWRIYKYGDLEVLES